ncbi:hypothetical protein [Caballeronia sp. dw_19]|uniref:hypothetical protein n=1 Tax=Caballeronia sp. dw_19 TaxID=2719791 RepID=UPI001BD52FF8|nr:hypothetical protein [Caballeronia sp. dw_19]
MSNAQPKQHDTYCDQLDTVIGRESFPIASDPVSERVACTAQCQGKWLAHGNRVLEKFSDFQWFCRSKARWSSIYD